MKRMLCVLAAALLSLPVAHADVLDQSQTSITSGSYFIVGTNPSGVQYVIGQIYTAGLDGYLRRVQVYIENDSASPVTGGLLLSVQTVTADGLPSGREIASHSIPVCPDDPVASCVPRAGSPGWVEFSLPPALLSAGTRYALVLRAGGGGYLRWYDHVGPSYYPNGYMAGTSGSGWWAGDYDDMTFRTYVEPPILDQAQTVADSYGIVYSDLDPKAAQRMAQGFTPGFSGYLRRVRLLLENYDATSSIDVSIQPIDSNYNVPSDTPIASATIPFTSLPRAGNPLWVDVTFDYPWLIAGTEYAIVLSNAGSGSIKWHHVASDVYPGGREMARDLLGWYYVDIGRVDAAFETYMMEPVTRFTPPPPRVITPCVNRACPEAKGGLTPADSVDGIKMHLLFKEKPNGTVQGTFSFTDDWPDGVSFEDCGTGSSACQLRIITFMCTGPNSMTVVGSIKRAEDSYASGYELNLSGTGKGSGTITLEIPRRTYTFTHDRIVEVSCP
jgi:hypothetical protein